MGVNHENELFETCVDFFHFSMSLLKDIGPKNRNLKFAVVNIQITLELFIKYYLVKKGYKDKIMIVKEGKAEKYKDFAVILSTYFKSIRWSYGEKKELEEILHARNSIVHKGLKAGWDDELAIYLIKCVLFIHGTMLKSFGISLLEDYTTPNPISTNSTWRKGIEIFIENMSSTREFPVFTCPECEAYSFIPSEILGIDLNPDECFQCLCCLNSYNIEVEAALIDCYKCAEPESYLIDRLNSNDKQQHRGKCLECKIDTLVRRCYECKCFYHPMLKENTFNNKYFCSIDCKEIYKEIYQQNK